METTPVLNILNIPKGSAGLGHWNTIRFSGRNIGANMAQRLILPVVSVERNGQVFEGHTFRIHDQFGTVAEAYYSETEPLAGMVQFWLETDYAILIEPESGGAASPVYGAPGQPVRIYVNKLRLTKAPPYRPALVAEWGPNGAQRDHCFEIDLAQGAYLMYRPHNPHPDGTIIWLTTTAAIELTQWTERPTTWPQPREVSRG